MTDDDHDQEIPNLSELLAEIGLDPRANGDSAPPSGAPAQTDDMEADQPF